MTGNAVAILRRGRGGIKAKKNTLLWQSTTSAKSPKWDCPLSILSQRGDSRHFGPFLPAQAHRLMQGVIYASLQKFSRCSSRVSCQYLLLPRSSWGSRARYVIAEDDLELILITQELFRNYPRIEGIGVRENGLFGDSFRIMAR